MDVWTTLRMQSVRCLYVPQVRKPSLGEVAKGLWLKAVPQGSGGTGRQGQQGWRTLHQNKDGDLDTARTLTTDGDVDTARALKTGQHPTPPAGTVAIPDYGMLLLYTNLEL